MLQYPTIPLGSYVLVTFKNKEKALYTFGIQDIVLLVKYME